MVVFKSGMDRSEEELSRFIEVCKDRGKVVVIGDMNARVEDSAMEGIVGTIWSIRKE